jgi:hypothetical protein
MSRKGLSLLIKDENIFACNKTQINTIHRSKFLVSEVIFNAAFGIESRMKKNIKLDFRRRNRQSSMLPWLFDSTYM